MAGLFFLLVVGLLILGKDIRSISGVSQIIETTIVAIGSPPSMVTVQWTSHITEDVQYNLFYNTSNDSGCPNRTGMILASWCRKNAVEIDPHRMFECDITDAYTKLDIFERHAYYNLCVTVVANTSSGLQYYSNMLQEDLAVTTQCPVPQNLTANPGKRNLVVTWRCPDGVVEEYYCNNLIVYKVMLTKNGHCVNQPHEIDTDDNTIFEDLQPDTKYNVTVCCSLLGFIPPGGSCDCRFLGPSSSLTVTTKEDAPRGQPEFMQCNAKCSKQGMIVDLTYKAPDNSTWYGNPVNYTVTYWKKLSSLQSGTKIVKITKTFHFAGTQTTFTLSGLDQTSEYHIEAGLCTGGGCGPKAVSSFQCETCVGGIVELTTQRTIAKDDPWSASVTLGLAIVALSFLMIAMPVTFYFWKRRTKKRKAPLREFHVSPGNHALPEETHSTGFNDYDELVSTMV